MVWNRCKRYLAHVVAESRKELGEADLVAFIKGLIAPAALTLIGLFGIRAGWVWPSVLISAAGWLGLAILWLIIVPSRIWEQQVERLTPRINVDEAKVEHLYGRDDYNDLFIRVHNLADVAIVDCEAQVVSVEPDVLGIYQPFFLRWSSSDGGRRHASFQTTGAIHIGYTRRGDGADLRLCPADYSGMNTQPVPPLFGGDDWCLEVVISAANTAPVRLKVHVTTEGHSYITEDDHGRRQLQIVDLPPKILTRTELLNPPRELVIPQHLGGDRLAMSANR